MRWEGQGSWMGYTGNEIGGRIIGTEMYLLTCGGGGHCRGSWGSRMLMVGADISLICAWMGKATGSYVYGLIIGVY